VTTAELWSEHGALRWLPMGGIAQIDSRAQRPNELHSGNEPAESAPSVAAV